MKFDHEHLTSEGDNLKYVTEKILNLSTAEMELASMIKSGLSATDIARQTNMSLVNVKTQRKNIRKKLGITNGKVSLECYLISHVL